MDSVLCESLQEQILLTFNWTQDLVYNPSDGLPFVNLAKEVGSNPNIPKNFYHQPAEDKFLSGSYVCLPLRYKGSAAASEVTSFLRICVKGHHCWWVVEFII